METTPNRATPNDDLDNAKLVTVFECRDEPGAALRVHVLADAGIRAVAVGGLTAGLRAEAPGWVQVKVMEDNEEEAKRVLSEVKRVGPGTRGLTNRSRAAGQRKAGCRLNGNTTKSDGSQLAFFGGEQSGPPCRRRRGIGALKSELRAEHGGCVHHAPLDSQSMPHDANLAARLGLDHARHADRSRHRLVLSPARLAGRLRHLAAADDPAGSHQLLRHRFLNSHVRVHLPARPGRRSAAHRRVAGLDRGRYRDAHRVLRFGVAQAAAKPVFHPGARPARRRHADLLGFGDTNRGGRPDADCLRRHVGDPRLRHRVAGTRPHPAGLRRAQPPDRVAALAGTVDPGGPDPRPPRRAVPRGARPRRSPKRAKGFTPTWTSWRSAPSPRRPAKAT